MKCTSCGTENRDGARMCRQCGRPLAPSELSTGPMGPGESQPQSAQPQSAQTAAGGATSCPACGAPIKAGAHFCARCGTSLGAQAGPASGGPPPASGAAPAGAPPPTGGPSSAGFGPQQPGPYPQGEPQSYSRSIPQGASAPGFPEQEPSLYTKPPVDIASAPQPVSLESGKGAGRRKRKLPTWAILVAVLVFLLCAAGTVFAGIKLADIVWPSDETAAEVPENLDADDPGGTEDAGEPGETEDAGEPGETEDGGEPVETEEVVDPPAVDPSPPADDPDPAPQSSEEVMDLQLVLNPPDFSNVAGLLDVNVTIRVKNIKSGYTLEDVRCQLQGPWLRYVTPKDDSGLDAWIDATIPYEGTGDCIFNLTPRVPGIDLQEMGVFVVGQSVPDDGGGLVEKSENLLDLLLP